MVVSAMAEICGLLFMDAGHLEMTADLKKLVMTMGEKTGRAVTFAEAAVKTPMLNKTGSFYSQRGSGRLLSRRLTGLKSSFAYIVYSPTNAGAEAHVLSSMIGKHTKRCAHALLTVSGRFELA